MSVCEAVVEGDQALTAFDVSASDCLRAAIRWITSALVSSPSGGARDGLFEARSDVRGDFG